ncbi:MAG: HNH endonuclease [Actinobacteria bacterium]|nr:HNH endonuclease [Actinomycetota bacterium]
MPRPRSWTDDQLRDAVATSTTYREVVLRLGLAPSGYAFSAVRGRAAQLELDDSHLAVTASWTDADLREAVTRAKSLNQVFANLGLQVGGSQWLTIRERINELRLDTSHFEVGVLAPRPRRGRRRSWTDDDLRRAVDGARSIAEIQRRLGLTPGGSSHETIKRRMSELGLETSALKGQGWSRGVRTGTDRGRPLDEILIENSDYRSTRTLKRRLLRVGLLEPHCELCGGDEWQGRPMPLRLDHINGDRRDHRLENLRLLCANCDAQTDTYCGRNIGRYSEG